MDIELKTVKLAMVKRWLAIAFVPLLILASYFGTLWSHIVINDYYYLHAFFTSHPEKFCYALLDVFVFFVVPLLIAIWRKKTLPLLVTFIVYHIFLFVNVLYARYFDAYMPFDLYARFEYLNGLSSSISNLFRPTDALLVMVLLASVYYWLWSCKNAFFRGGVYCAIVLLLSLVVAFLLLILAQRDSHKTYYVDRCGNKTIFGDLYTDFQRGEPLTNYSFMNYGYALNFYYYLDRKAQAAMYCKRKSSILRGYHRPKNEAVSCADKNLILILVESLSSYAVNRSFHHRPVTPFLNALAKQNDVYFSPDMTCETRQGQSSDGQFIYMVGLSPCRTGITINDFSDNSFIPIADLLPSGISYHSRMVIPTGKETWSQERMCEKYHIRQLLCVEDVKEREDKSKWLTDKEVFRLAERADTTSSLPFFSTILTSSTHMPYNHRIESTGIVYPADMSEELKCYLDNVHYTDKCIEGYIASLKANGLYDSSVIIIVADHQPRPTSLGYPGSSLFDAIPVWIINGGVHSKRRKLYQVDLFPTIADMYQSESSWRGVGTSIFQDREYTDIDKEEVSLQLLYSDYFAQ